MKDLLALYGLNEAESTIKNFGSGLINTTWLISNGEKYILQKINKDVFANPKLIDDNIHIIDNYLRRYRTGYKFITPLPSINGKTLVHYKHEYFRLMKFIPSVTYTVVNDEDVAFEAAKQFGKFTKYLSGLNTNRLYETIPHFHNIKLRYRQFLQAIKSGNKKRIHHAETLIQTLKQHKNIVDVYDMILKNPSFKKRVTHHDTKISNVLFDINNMGIAIVDLDTLMPGYFISDAGDMLRTYLCPVSEEEVNFDLIEVRDEYFKAVAKGYLDEMKKELTDDELDAFVYAGKFMIYMQALRFITDYLNDDIYYGAKYPNHNFNRAQNQARLLQCLIAKEEYYNSIVMKLTISG